MAALVAGCGQAPPLPEAPERLQVVTTTAVLGDLVRQVAGERAEVLTLVPPGADPHSYEPSLRNVRSIAYAQVALSNYLMLEQHSVIKAIDSSLPPGAANVSLAERAGPYGAHIIPLVENATLDTIWLGLRVRGTGHDVDRTSEIDLQLTSVDGPGDVYAYVTGTFGQPLQFLNSSDGLDDRDRSTLPADAHTHMSWAFTESGTYRLGFAGRLRATPGAAPLELARGEVVVQVGEDPRGVAGLEGRGVLDIGHADITVDLDTDRLYLFADPTGGGEHTQEIHALDDTVIWVPPKALQEIPASPSFRFLGRPGTLIHQLPQAVLGAHVHGEIDPHLWLSVPNAQAYVKVIRDTLIAQDPAGAEVYRERAEAYLAELGALDDEIRATVAGIPQQRRQLITTHDAYAYLADDLGFRVAGFVSPNPAVEPSVAQRGKLARTIRDLGVPAVFLEPTVVRESSVLQQVADDAGVAVCTIYSDSFDTQVTSYVELMRFNAAELSRCLGEG
ncbi:MAG TPA: anchored repeat ABC transporter, substrate-binding protein [Arachnia sp.]|nr:anchored repeat ABC transporter, substrate-binding protein [Arachnia sp.]HMT87074.1 anchored repeat ABC transporter, substrate-binding protein [Arachnia sp.]